MNDDYFAIMFSDLLGIFIDSLGTISLDKDKIITILKLIARDQREACVKVTKAQIIPGNVNNWGEGYNAGIHDAIESVSTAEIEGE